MKLTCGSFTESGSCPASLQTQLLAESVSGPALHYPDTRHPEGRPLARTMPIMLAPKDLKKAMSAARSQRVWPGSPTMMPVPTWGFYEHCVAGDRCKGAKFTRAGSRCKPIGVDRALCVHQYAPLTWNPTSLSAWRHSRRCSHDIEDGCSAYNRVMSVCMRVYEC